MKIIKTHELTPSDIALASDSERLWIYNGLDACVTDEVLNVLLPQLDNQTRSTYEFEKALQAPILEMRLRGILVDQEERSRVIAAYQKDLVVLERNLTKLLKEGLDLEINWRSNDHLKSLFYKTLGLPSIKKRNLKGEYVPTVNREALEKLNVHFYAQPIIAHILGLRDIGKKIGVLKTDIDSDGRMRTSYNIAGTNTGRLSSSLSDFGTGCVLPSAEALTRNGWRRIDEILNGCEIAQWDNGVISFVPCSIHQEQSNSGMLQFKTEQTQLTVTKGHRVLFNDYYNTNFRSETAQLVSDKPQITIPLGGSYDSGGTLAYPAFLSMLMADFSKESTGWKGSFSKKRKINRFLSLAQEFGIKYTEQRATKGYRRFYVSGFLNFPKRWGEWILNLSAETAEQLLEEARYWDSHDRGSGFIFHTAHQSQAEWFATLAHLCNRSATVRRMEQNEGSYSDTIMWCVNVKNRAHAQIMRKHWRNHEYRGTVYCPQVPSSYWLVRENGFISVTGNTNLQNIEQRLRRIFVADPGYKLAYIDLEQAESRAVGAIEWNLFRDGKYLDACESGDLHTSVCRLAWTNLAFTGDIKKDREIAERPFYRQHSYRHMAKVLGHGTNYNGKPFTMAQHTKLDAKLIEDFQIKYFAAFPAHKQWHGAVALELQISGKLTSLTGRRRCFFGRRNDDATVREAIAFNPQGSVGDLLNQGMLAVWRSQTCQLLLQIHDAILVQYPEALEEKILPQVLKLIQIPIELSHGRKLIIPSEAKCGWNWAEADETIDGVSVRTNPDGLVKWKGKDERRRTRTPSNNILDRHFL